VIEATKVILSDRNPGKYPGDTSKRGGIEAKFFEPGGVLVHNLEFSNKGTTKE